MCAGYYWHLNYIETPNGKTIILYCAFIVPLLCVYWQAIRRILCNGFRHHCKSVTKVSRVAWASSGFK